MKIVKAVVVLVVLLVLISSPYFIGAVIVEEPWSMQFSEFLDQYVIGFGALIFVGGGSYVLHQSYKGLHALIWNK